MGDERGFQLRNLSWRSMRNMRSIRELAK